MHLYRQACDATELSTIMQSDAVFDASSLALRTPRSTIQLLQAAAIPGNWELLLDPVHRTMYSPILQPEGQLYRSRSVGSVRTFRCCYSLLARLFLDTLLLHIHKLSQPWPCVSGSSCSSRVSRRLVCYIQYSDDDDEVVYVSMRTITGSRSLPRGSVIKVTAVIIIIG
jgi:hypothetical protein